MNRSEQPLLAVNNLSLAFDTYQGRAWVLDNVSLSVRPGEVLGLVGGKPGAGNRSVPKPSCGCCRNLRRAFWTEAFYFTVKTCSRFPKNDSAVFEAKAYP